MSFVNRPVFSAGQMRYCDAIKEIFGSVCEISVACCDVTGARKTISSAPEVNARTDTRSMDSRGIELDVGEIVDIRATRLGVEDLALLASMSEALPEVSGKGHWFAFVCRFASGTKDIIAVYTKERNQSFAGFLRKVWPGLRRMSLHEPQPAKTDPTDDAMLWMVSKKVNASIIVLDKNCRVLKVNAAGRELLTAGKLIRSTEHGLCCGREAENQALKQAIAECLQSQQKTKPEYIIILRGPDGTSHLPMSVSAFFQSNSGTPLFLVMLPMPPDQKRIEGLAIEMGLTPSEARVAALIRSGLSNREAAKISGLKIETFNTYAKRALSKMNVSCRAEMAQMLTWQASMERSL